MAMDLFYKAAGAVIAPFRYAKREVKNLKENIKEDTQEAIAKVLKLAVAAFCSVLFLIFLSVMIALVINKSMDHEFAGFAIVAGFYLLVGVGMYFWNAHDKNKVQHTKNQLRDVL